MVHRPRSPDSDSPTLPESCHARLRSPGIPQPGRVPRKPSYVVRMGDKRIEPQAVHEATHEQPPKPGTAHRHHNDPYVLPCPSWRSGKPMRGVCRTCAVRIRANRALPLRGRQTGLLALLHPLFQARPADAHPFGHALRRPTHDLSAPVTGFAAHARRPSSKTPFGQNEQPLIRTHRHREKKTGMPNVRQHRVGTLIRARHTGSMQAMFAGDGYRLLNDAGP